MQLEANILEITFQIIEQILGEEHAEDVMASGLDLLVQALKSEAGAVWVPAAEEDNLYPAFCTGPVELEGPVTKEHQVIEYKVAVSGKSRIADETEKRKEMTEFDRAGCAVRNYVCTPIKSLGKVSGCMIIVNKRDNDPYSSAEIQMCERVGALISMVMQEEGYAYQVPEKKQTLLRARNIVKDYPSGGETIRVLKGINLDIYKGEFVVLLGESGCGKSTLVNIIAGMDDMTEGTLTVGDKDFSHPSDAELTAFRRSDVGFVFQSYNLMPNLTALENVRFLAELVPDPMPPREALDRVGLGDRAGHYPSMLSGGQQQRVSIARAIVKKPKFIFADEPTAALDYQTSIEVLSVFEEIVRSQETTVVMITHNPEIAKMADRVIRIRDGQVSSIRTNKKPAHAQDLVW